ncbi:MAG: dimethylsulfonioproprionate lyase family protein [Dongiaceae bacterium]
MAALSMSGQALNAALQQFLAAIDRLLARNPAASAPFRPLLPRDRIGLTASIEIEPSLPVQNFWLPALSTAKQDRDGVIVEIAQTLEVLTPSLRWRQNPNYRQAPPDARFLANYGYAEICGELGLIPTPDLKLGVLVLGPDTCYPAHQHPAEEIYLPLHAAFWQRGDEEVAAKSWQTRPAGAVIHHPSQMPHATRTGDSVLAAIYLWRGELATNARLQRREIRD